MMNKNNHKIHIYLDIDGVLATSNNMLSKNLHPKYQCYRFDYRCVKIINQIIDGFKPIIILSSDWKYHFNIKEMNEIFEWNGIKSKISDITPIHWGYKFTSYQELEACRASEILGHVNENDIKKYIAIDDLDLKPWLGDNFIHTPRVSEGIKQTGILNKIKSKINYYEKE